MGFCFSTITAKLRWNKSFEVDGLFAKRLDTQIMISGLGRIINKGSVRFQRSVSLTSVGGILYIGQNASYNRNCISICPKSIRIEEKVIFGPNAMVHDHDHMFADERIWPRYKHGGVVMERGCWTAAEVTDSQNTLIGKGCVIKVGTSAKGEVLPHSFVKVTEI